MLLLSLFSLLNTVLGAQVSPSFLDSAVQPQRKPGIQSTFQWNSTRALIGPKNDDRKIAGIKDPSVVYVDGRYHLFASTAKSGGSSYNLVYITFTDFEQAPTADFFYLDQSAIGVGYRAAPQVFYFEPHGLWYLVFQNDNAAYSTNKNISDPSGWSAVTNFYDKRPAVIDKNIADGYWVDMWVICDDENCHLFSSDDMGQLYRSQTKLTDFPRGFDSNNTVIAKSDKRFDLFEASNVYRIENGSYLLIVECIDAEEHRWFRSWTAESLEGPWDELAATNENPFARRNNVAFSGPTWTKDISHGEIIRDKVDQTLTITPCKLQYMYQGRDPNVTTNYNNLPWKLALLTQTNSEC
ncbi:glycoside hydrolase family 62 protein [Aaosphaeria arxii CBS 175.79]|uniref:Alpha-L-arabinofuranosidase n=1 Tax=Aaosphaeria arxii CBS 175.79 TaxID=1450172 RepID=A0A6A5XTU0_9PLEO|nr:glycoside hydrolase family 62 protein [Aaosphaeria arxii CBS 175.79]KAF2015664.1 glycoside hydrolase family 62 protein [Aaosphaeria arxii CBS 175.79]